MKRLLVVSLVLLSFGMMGCAKGYRTDLSLGECKARLNMIGWRRVDTLNTPWVVVEKAIVAHNLEQYKIRVAKAKKESAAIEARRSEAGRKRRANAVVRDDGMIKVPLVVIGGDVGVGSRGVGGESHRNRRRIRSNLAQNGHTREYFGGIDSESVSFGSWSQSSWGDDVFSCNVFKGKFLLCFVSVSLRADGVGGTKFWVDADAALFEWGRSRHIEWLIAKYLEGR